MSYYERDYAESYVDDPARCTSCGLRLHVSAPLCRECAEEGARQFGIKLGLGATREEILSMNPGWSK